MNKYRLAALAGVMLVACAILWIDLRKSSPPVLARTQKKSEMPSGAITATSVTKLLPQRIKNSPPVTNQKYVSRYSVAETPGELALQATPAARSGSPAAMNQLANALKACAHADMGTDDEIELRMAKVSLRKDALDKSSSEKNVAMAADEAKHLERLRDSCKNISEDETRQWLNWLEMAAAAGDSRARASYAWSALDDFKTDEARIANAEEYARRRDLANEYLQDSVANGDCSNGILNGFRKVSRDPLSAYIYQGLLIRQSLSQLARSGSPPEIVDRETSSLNAWLKNLASAVPPDQLADAESASEYILQNFCQSF